MLVRSVTFSLSDIPFIHTLHLMSVLYGRGIFIISRLVLELVSSLVMELALVKDVPLLDWSGKIGNREGIRLCKNFCKKRNSVTTYPIFCLYLHYMFFVFLTMDKLFRWISIGSDLKYDARRDLDDVGAKCVEGADLQIHQFLWVMSKMELQLTLSEAILCK